MKTILITDADNDTITYLMGRRVGMVFTIGRSSACEIPMPDDFTLSQRHCSVTLTEKGLLLRDLGSTNGTYRNGSPVQEEIMQPGVIYTAGHAKLEMKESGAPAPAEQPQVPEKKKKKAQKATHIQTPHPAEKVEKTAAPNASSPAGSPPPRKAEAGPKTQRPPKRKRPRRLPEWLFYLVRGLILLAVIGGCYALYHHLAETMMPPSAEQEEASTDTPSDTSAEQEGTRETENDDDIPDGDDTEEEDTTEDTTEEDDDTPPTDTDDTPLPPDQPDQELPAQEGERDFAEEEVPVDPKQSAVPASRLHAQMTARLAQAHHLIKKYEKTEKAGYTQTDCPADAWSKPYGLYQRLAERTLSRMKNLDDGAALQFLQSPSNRLDLARLTLIRRAGTATIKTIAGEPKGAEMLAAITQDLNWCDGLLHSGPVSHWEQTLRFLLLLYSIDGNAIRNDDVLKKAATACAIESARMGLSDADADRIRERYRYYSSGYKERKINFLFSTLQYWDMRFVLGANYSVWTEIPNLVWLRDNVRLPAERYLGCESQLHYNMRNIAGDSIFSAECMLPIRKYTKGILPWQHREMGGVCAHLSPYAAHAALAAGIPAATVVEPGHESYVVRIGDEWKPGYSIYWRKSINKNLWNKGEWDFLILMQKLYSDRHRTMAADELISMGDFLAARKKVTAAFSCYELALKIQPLNWPAYGRYAGYLQQKAPKDAEKWHHLHDEVLQGIGKEHHCVAAHLMSDYVYPGLVPQIQDSKERNKLFASFFRSLKDWGSNQWDISALLNAQIKYCTHFDAQKDFLHQALFVLMQKPIYAGSVLMWGTHYAQTLTNEKEKERFCDALLIAMSRVRYGNRKNGQLWDMFCEAIAEAEASEDREAFQMIGKLAKIKCADRFPKHKPKVPRLRGVLLSARGSICRKAVDNFPNACLHWSVLQADGGHFFCAETNPKCREIVVKLAETSHINGVVLSLTEPLEKSVNMRGFHMSISDDGISWRDTDVVPTYDDKSIVVFDAQRHPLPAQYVRLHYLYDQTKGININMNAIHVYGTPAK